MKDLINQVDKYEYVSFDIFDTLIKRNVRKPKDVFTLMQLYYENKNTKVFSSFRENRLASEQRARELSIKEDITLDEIYEQLKDFYSADLVEDLKQLEIRTELEICVTNPDMIAIYNYCVEKGKKILIASDMYLPQNVIEEILRKNGIDKYQKLYLSSEIGVRKITGNLFKYILEDLKIIKKQLIHIGDGRNNDFVQPRLLGIKSLLIPSHINHLNYYYEQNMPDSDLFAYHTTSSFINNSIVRNESAYWKIGYETLGPLLYGFSQWLLASLKAKEIKKVFFFSRDGYIMQKAFDSINNAGIETRYLYASRRALIVPLIWKHPELKDIVASMFIPKRISVETFIKKLGLNPENYVSQLKNYGLELATMLNGKALQDSDAFFHFYKELKEDVINNSKREYCLLLKYLEQIGFEGNVAIVDIGWNGNMQRALCELFKIEKRNTKIVGYYTGILPTLNGKKNDNREMYGFLFQDGENEELFRRENCFNSIFETVFLAQHGSVKRYSKSEQGITPVLYPYEYLKADGIYAKEAEVVSDVQRGALDFVDSFAKSKLNKYLVISPYCALQNMQRLGTAPHQCDAELFGEFRFYDTDVKYIAKPRRLMHYIFQPQKLYSDFLNTPWRIGFMRRLFRVSLPYFDIYMLIRKFFLEKK